jgi:proteasome lid subunit RPN8/RPN11
VKPFTIARRELRRLQTRAIRAQQHEVCGLFFADDRNRISLIFVRNCSPDPRRFAMTRSDFFATKKQGSGTFLGIFHSHPSAPATPSASDLKIRGGGVRYQLIFDVRGREVKLWRQGSMVPLSLVP